MSPLLTPAVKVLHQLATLQDACWDPALVRETVDITGLMERCAASSDSVNVRLKEETGEDSIYALAAKTLRESAPNWRVYDREVDAGNAAGWNGGEAVDWAGMDFSDDFWLNGPFNV
jgi:hypothetical protein